MTKRLTVVTDSTKPAAPKRPSTIKEAVDLSERDLLVSMRSKVAAEIDGGVPAHALAGLMRQLREFDKEIRAIDAREEQEAAKSVATEDAEWEAI